MSPAWLELWLYYNAVTRSYLLFPFKTFHPPHVTILNDERFKNIISVENCAINLTYRIEHDPEYTSKPDATQSPC
jgi:hypothetical protein